MHKNLAAHIGMALLAAGLSVSPARASGQARDLTFKIMVPLKFKGRTVSGSLRKSQIAGLLNLPVRNGDSDPKSMYGVEMTWPSHKTRMVYTCRQWKNSRAEKAYSATTYDMAMEGYLIHTCTLLYALQNARRPRVSYIAHPRVTLADLNLLPAEMLSFMPYDKREEERLRSLTVAQVVPSTDIKEATSDTLRLSYSGLDQVFWEAARADFNGDGFEDVLVFIGGDAVGGTMGYSGYIVLTRTRPSGPLKVIQIPGP